MSEGKGKYKPHYTRDNRRPGAEHDESFWNAYHFGQEAFLRNEGFDRLRFQDTFLQASYDAGYHQERTDAYKAVMGER